MELKERLKKVRKSQPKKLTQSVFAEMLGTKRDTIANYEGGRVEPTDTFIQLLCTKFNINEHWLRTGEGEMKEAGAADIFAMFAAQHNLTPAEREVMRYCFFLPPADRAALLTHITNLADTIRAAEDTERANAPAANQQHTMTDDEIEADVAAYRAALIAEKEAALASSSTAAAKMA